MELDIMPRFSIVIPCYKSSKTIEKVVVSTSEEMDRLGIGDYEFVLVNDCSPDEDQTARKLFELADRFDYVKVVDLAKNMGQHNATMAGLNYAAGDFIISMDDDMQTNPSEIKKLWGKMNEGYDIVYGYYEKKEESLFRRFGSYLNYLTVRILIKKPKWLKTSSFWIIRRYVRDYAIQYQNPNVHLQGVFLRITSKIACLPIVHVKREVGKSGYTLKKLVRVYMNILAYSIMPLRIVQGFGFLLALVGLITDIVVLIRKLVTPHISVGWTSLIGAVCLFTGAILIAIGVVGDYVGRLYMGQTREPQFTVRETRNIKH